MGPAYQPLVRVGPNLQALVVLMIDGFRGIWSSAVGLRGAHSTGVLPKRDLLQSNWLHMKNEVLAAGKGSNQAANKLGGSIAGSRCNMIR